MSLTLRSKAATTLPVDGDGLRPEDLAGRGPAEVARLPIRVGNAMAEIGELFEVGGDVGDDQLVLEGDLRPFREIGQGMTAGLLTILGDVGPGLGARLMGGRIEVNGSVGDGAGMAMRGGLIRIKGAAGPNLGGAEPGATLGMRDGAILVEGPIGDDAGLAMRRGLIAVLGDAGDGLGRGLVAGSIFAFGKVGRFPGLGMKRGTIALFGADAPEILPTFAPSGRDRPPFVTIYLRWLQDRGFPVPVAAFAGAFERYNGDLVEGGQGEVLVWKRDR